MATLKNTRVAAHFCCTPDSLEALLKDSRYSLVEVAGIIGANPQHLANLLAEPDPVPLVAPTVQRSAKPDPPNPSKPSKRNRHHDLSHYTIGQDEPQATEQPSLLTGPRS